MKPRRFWRSTTSSLLRQTRIFSAQQLSRNGRLLKELCEILAGGGCVAAEPERRTREKHTAFTAVPRYFAVPALLGFLLILGPLVGLLYNIPWMRLHDIIDKEVLDAARLSLTTASISTLICGLLGAPLALVLSKVLSRSHLKNLGEYCTRLFIRP